MTKGKPKRGKDGLEIRRGEMGWAMVWTLAGGAEREEGMEIDIKDEGQQKQSSLKRARKIGFFLLPHVALSLVLL